MVRATNLTLLVLAVSCAKRVTTDAELPAQASKNDDMVANTLPAGDSEEDGSADLPTLTTSTARGAVSRKEALPELETVPAVDIERYLGKWYEIASIPRWFQWFCVAAEAEYSLGEDGKILVENRCRNGSVDGSYRTVNGTAELVDTESQSKLEVTFFRFFKGDYWIIELDPDYRFAVVGDPKRKSLWLLSRERQMNDELYESLIERIEKTHYYDRSKIKKTIQPK